jgi:stage V sporulation protein B
MSVKNQIIKGTIVLTLASLLSRVFGFLYRIFLSNLIGAKGMGIFQLIFPVLGFCVALSCGGIQIAVSRFVAECKNNKDKFLVLISSIIMSLFLSTFTAVVLYVFSEPVSLYIIKNSECALLLKYASVTIPLTTFHSCISGYYLGLKKTCVPALSSIFEQVIKVISVYVLGLVWIEKGIELTPMIAVYSMILSELGGVLFCVISVGAEKKYAFKIRQLFFQMKNLFSVSYILTINKIMITFLQCIEAIIVPIVLVKSGMSNHDALSIYGILTGMALPVITFPSAINSSVSTMILPAIAGANADGQTSNVKKTTEISIWFSLVTGIFCIGIFLCYGDFIGATIFGHEEAGEYIKILAWLCPFMYLSITLGSVLHGLGKTNTAFIHNVIGTAIRLFCLWFIVPVIGITGYLWGLLISNLVVTFLHGYYIYKEIHFSFSAIDSIIKPTAWLFCSMVAGKLINYILNFSSYSGKIFDIATAIVSAGTIFFVFLYFLRMEIKYLKI